MMPSAWTSRGEIPQVTVNSRRRRSQYNIKAPSAADSESSVFNESLFRWYPPMVLGNNVFYAVSFHVYCTLYINITLLHLHKRTIFDARTWTLR
jgi:hypothetical protein